MDVKETHPNTHPHPHPIHTLIHLHPILIHTLTQPIHPIHTLIHPHPILIHTHTPPASPENIIHTSLRTESGSPSSTSLRVSTVRYMVTPRPYSCQCRSQRASRRRFTSSSWVYRVWGWGWGWQVRFRLG